MKKNSEDQIVKAMVKEIRALEDKHEVIALTVSPYILFSVISGLQLALRHPEISRSEEIRETIYKFATEAQTAFKDCPVLSDIIETAWKTIEVETSKRGLPQMFIQTFDDAYRLEIGSLMILWEDAEFREVIKTFQAAYRCQKSLTRFELPLGEMVVSGGKGTCDQSQS